MHFTAQENIPLRKMEKWTKKLLGDRSAVGLVLVGDLQHVVAELGAPPDVLVLRGQAAAAGAHIQVRVPIDLIRTGQVLLVNRWR